MENNSEDQNISKADLVFKSIEELKEMLREKFEVKQENDDK